MSDEKVNHPRHYNDHPSGVEAVDVCENFSFNFGNALKYLFRTGLKPGESGKLDLQKTRWYLERARQGRERTLYVGPIWRAGRDAPGEDEKWHDDFLALVGRVVEAAPDTVLGKSLAIYLRAQREHCDILDEMIEVVKSFQ